MFRTILKGLEFFFTKYQHEFTDEQCLDLLKWFSEPTYNNMPIIETMIAVRPRLATTFGSEIEEIKDRLV